ncbi:MAG: HupE/UreJ family protein [Methylococcaceae bacterium]|nr:HupE/UreJ family protein [Methylococcaceae bacterium]
MINKCSFIVSLLLTISLVCWSSLAGAHPPGLSSLDINVSAETVSVKASFALQDLEAFVPMDADLDAEVSDTERLAAIPAIAKFVSEKTLIAIDESLLQPGPEGSVDFDEQNNAHVQWQLQGRTGKQLSVQSTLLALLAEGHQQYLTVRWRNGQVLAEKLLSRQQAEYQLAIDPEALAQPSASSFADFFKLGIEHILTGYDHLLFLLALLAVTHRFWPALKIITFFTIAHSFTLACAGFASAGSGIVLPLLAFNLGIESGQIAVASLILPLIWWLNNQAKIAPIFLKTCSILVSLMGLFWFIERIL